MSEPFLGEIRIVGFNFAPQGWAMCQGQTLAITQNTALFSLLGTMYGGDGITTFCLPNLQSRLPIGVGQGLGLSTYVQGEMGGTESVTLTLSQMPTHTHTGSTATVAIPASSALAETATPDATSILAQCQDTSGQATPVEYTSGAATTTLKPFNSNVTVGNAGGNVPTTVINPFLALNFIIAMQGIFPSRS